MTAVTLDTKAPELAGIPELRAYYRYLIYQPDFDMASSPFWNRSLRELASVGWSAKAMAEGLNALIRASAQGRVKQHFIYSEAECTQDKHKRDVNLIQLTPAAPDLKKPYVILCAGGGYVNVCTMVEALPTAKHMLDAGYTVFLMTYRVSVPMAALAALDDLAKAVLWLGSHADETGVDPARYAVGGFSAGANLVCNWGCAHIGWKHYGAPKPLCLFPVYTYIDLKPIPGESGPDGILPRSLGDDWREKIEKYSVAEHVDGDYPPCCIVCGKDDETVPCSNSELLKERLDAAKIPSVLEEGAHAPHGFGDGTGTDVEGWPERALRFMESLA